MVVGTANYMSPEQARGGDSRPAFRPSSRSAWSSIACLTGQPAFERSGLRRRPVAAIIEDELHAYRAGHPGACPPGRSAAMPGQRPREVATPPRPTCTTKAETHPRASLRNHRRTDVEHRRRDRSGEASCVVQAIVLSLAALPLPACSACILLLPPTADLTGYSMTPPGYRGGLQDSAGVGAALNGKDIAYSASDVDGVLQIFVRGVNSPTRAQITKAPADCQTPDLVSR